MGAGRFICVAMPFALTVCSLICLLIAMLAGVTNNGLDMFEIKTQNLSLSSNSLANLESLITKRSPLPTTTAHGLDFLTAAALAPNPVESATTTTGHGVGFLTIAALSPNPVSSAAAAASSAVSSVLSGTNITAADLGLANSYKISLFTYCNVTDTKTQCGKAKFNWAASTLNTTLIEATASATVGQTVTLPTELKAGLKTFIAFSKWTQVVYLIAIVTVALELVLGIFAICSRAGSCLTSLICSLATFVLIAASIMATVQASIATGAIKAAAKDFGVEATINTSFLATTWLAVAFSLAAGLFWTFSTCCCAANHKSSKRNSAHDQEKLVPTGSYQRVSDSHNYNNNQAYAGQQQGIYNGAEYGAPAKNVRAVERGNAYEPYSHGAV